MILLLNSVKACDMNLYNLIMKRTELHDCMTDPGMKRILVFHELHAENPQTHKNLVNVLITCSTVKVTYTDVTKRYHLISGER